MIGQVPAMILSVMSHLGCRHLDFQQDLGLKCHKQSEPNHNIVNLTSEAQETIQRLKQLKSSTILPKTVQNKI